ncbi:MULTISPECIES: amphi-Trp domain-containing protein [unclassified Haladaptatus]|uniref:amphi-Trp domain-containing protein n=1 Tax=unclassified Haladaptatus TaxID=2622732 RepID=UPI0023E75A95|nr:MULTISPECIES: amphi-Trp domain-containing protein [unclassified Haladaptatus]
MPEEVLFKSEQKQTREEIAAYLRTVADKLDAGEEFSLSAGGESVTMNPPARVTFEVKAERETSRGAKQGELSIEFELEWDEGATDEDSSLSIS